MKRTNQYHGLTSNGKKHPLYKTREIMIYRCYRISPDIKNAYASYRGKGIKVCDEWLDNVLSFYHWAMNNGWRKGLSIDRIDPNGNYEPNNCQWISRSENSIKASYQNKKQGELITTSKLTADKVMAIKLLLRLGFNILKIANFFDISKTAICSINMKKSWKHVKEI